MKTNKEWRENKIHGYGIIPCLVLAIISVGIIANAIRCTSEMAFGLLLFGVLLFGTYTYIWFWLVSLWFKYFVK